MLSSGTIVFVFQHTGVVEMTPNKVAVDIFVTDFRQ